MNDRVRSGGIFAGCATLAFGVLVLFGAPKDTAHASEVQKAEGRNAAKEEEMAGEKFKNLQVLQDIPADQLLPSMRYIIASLGVSCDYCHDAQHFDNDDKPTKQRARNMMKMMFAINSDNFNGRREVTCYTCHRGAAKAATVAALSNSAAGATPAGGNAPATTDAGAKPAALPGDAGIALPNADEVFTKYVRAIGGSGAIQRNSTRIERGNVEGPRGLHATMEAYRKAPDKAFAVLHASTGHVTEGVNRQMAWGRRANGQVTDESGDELARSRQWAAFYPGENFEREYERFQVRGTESVDGHDAYLMMAWWPGGGTDRLYFDVQSGLLVRIAHRIESPLGALPLETDYGDYRDVDGLKIPFLVRVTRVDGSATYRWDKMEANAPVDDSRFDKPAAAKP